MSKMLGFKMATRHKRSKSFPDKTRVDEDGLESSSVASVRKKLDMDRPQDKEKMKKQHSFRIETQNSLKQEILELEKRLQNQFQVRSALEKALGYGTSCNETTTEIPMPKPATELIKEIAVLELEVGHLEQYLLSLYRKAFDQQISSVSPSSKEPRAKSPVTTPRRRLFDDPLPETTSKRETSTVQFGCQSLDNVRREPNDIFGGDKLLDSGVHRCHSTLSQRTGLPDRSSPTADSVGRALRACYSQPLSMMEYAQSAPNLISLAEHLGTHISDHIKETPNKLSEDMIKCMSAIYCKLSDPPLAHNGLSSPNSSVSSISAFSPQDQCDLWSPGCRNNSSFDTRLDNPFLVEGLKEFSGPYSTMVEVPWIHRDSQKLGDVEHLLQNFRSLVCRLEEVDPRKLKHEEKLAFWINVHNSLVMHAFLAYGIPQNNVKRLFLLLKASYNVGGRTISADMIQSSILGCRMSRPGQWLRLLISSKSKFKAGDERQAYTIHQAEPLLHFALCSGSHSDPAVRVYTAKKVFQELEAAKEEYVRATFGIRKDHKILLPKLVESFAKNSGLCQAGIIEMIQQSLPESVRKSIKKNILVGKPHKSIEWIPHSFSFRYLIHKDLVR